MAVDSGHWTSGEGSGSRRTRAEGAPRTGLSPVGRVEPAPLWPAPGGQRRLNPLARLIAVASLSSLLLPSSSLALLSAARSPDSAAHLLAPLCCGPIVAGIVRDTGELGAPLQGPAAATAPSRFAAAEWASEKRQAYRDSGALVRAPRLGSASRTGSRGRPTSSAVAQLSSGSHGDDEKQQDQVLGEPDATRSGSSSSNQTEQQEVGGESDLGQDQGGSDGATSEPDETSSVPFLWRLFELYRSTTPEPRAAADELLEDYQEDLDKYRRRSRPLVVVPAATAADGGGSPAAAAGQLIGWARGTPTGSGGRGGVRSSDFSVGRPQEPSSELVELLAAFYAHRQVQYAKAKSLARLIEYRRRQKANKGGGGGGGTQAEANRTGGPDEEGGGGGGHWLRASLRALRMLEADREGLMSWLRQRQKGFPTLTNTTFELLDAYPNRSINVCPDGPKILILPDGRDILHCYTAGQWVEKLWSDLRLSAFHYPIIALNVLIFLFGTTGNIFVCLSVYRNHQLRSVTNYFIVNLAFADFLVILICLPATGVWDLTLTWFFGTIPCKLIMFLQDVSISVSVLTLTAISLDRYYAVCHPLRFKTNLSQAKRTIAIIWLVSLLIMAPDLVYLSAKSSQELSEAGLSTVLYSDCNYDWDARCSSAFQFVKTILLYLVPLMLMFCAHYTIMRTLRVASTSCHNELQSMSGQMVGIRARRPSLAGLGGGNSRGLGRRPQSHYYLPGALGGRRWLHQQQQQKQATGRGSTGAATATAASGRLLGSLRRHRNHPNSVTLDEAPYLHDFSPPLAELQRRSLSDQDRKGPASETAARVATGRGEQVAVPPDRCQIEFGETTRGQHQGSLIADLVARYSLEARLTGQQAGAADPAAPVQRHLAGDRQPRHQSHQHQELGGSSGAADNEPLGQLLHTIHNRNRIESRQKAATMLAAIVLLFGICYLPVHLVNFLRQFIDDIPQTDVTSTISMLSHCVCYLNSAINPIIYNHMNSTFRAEFRKFLSSCCLCWRHRRRRRKGRRRLIGTLKCRPHTGLSAIGADAEGGSAGAANNHANDNCHQRRDSNDDDDDDEPMSGRSSLKSARGAEHRGLQEDGPTAVTDVGV